jgi:glycerol kinase
VSGEDCILAIDQGTTSSRAIVFDARGLAVASSQAELPQLYPDDGWVEHDPESIWTTTLKVAQEAFKVAEGDGHHVVAIGITNQRETTLVWDRHTGEPIYNAIVWQDRRTASVCDLLTAEGAGDEISSRTGLLVDPYFSATKIAWILNHVDGARARDLAFGTVDSFLVSRLTGGAVHATDATNASRTSLFNIHSQEWDDWLLDQFDVPVEVLPEVRDCDAHFGETVPELFGRPIAIRGIAGDQQAAAIGQCCLLPGSIKSTYGTGCFVLVNTGEEVLKSNNQLLSTVAARIGGKVTYGLEGSIFIAGAAVQWLRDGLGVIGNAAETESLARDADKHSGVYMVPAFTGLGAPHWKPDARGALFGLTRSTGPAELARAALEAVAYQTSDQIEAMAEDGVRPVSLRVDGGMVANDWFVQFLADILVMPVDRPRILETTAYGAALLAGRATGVYGDWDDIEAQWQLDKRFEPLLPDADRERLLEGWRDVVARVIS